MNEYDNVIEKIAKFWYIRHGSEYTWNKAKQMNNSLYNFYLTMAKVQFSDVKELAIVNRVKEMINPFDEDTEYDKWLGYATAQKDYAFCDFIKEIKE